MSSNPLVSIICLCYNQGRFVSETLHSVLDQTYPNIEIIVVDDGSTDNSVEVINDLVRQHTQIRFIPLKENVGNCKAFNVGYKFCAGAFVLDLAADDVLLPQRIQKQVDYFQQLDSDYGIVFTDAIYIDEDGGFMYSHYEHLLGKRLINSIPTGDVYRDVIGRYFISTPTMLSKREVFEVLNGYDENLSYEDFDFCIRASRIYKFAFLDDKLTKVRKVKNSMSDRVYKKNDRQLESTFQVCKKIAALNRTEAEQNALRKRLKYEIRHSILTNNNREAKLFFELLKDIDGDAWTDRVLISIAKLNLPLAPLRNIYHWFRYSN